MTDDKVLPVTLLTLFVLVLGWFCVHTPAPSCEPKAVPDAFFTQLAAGSVDPLLKHYMDVVHGLFKKKPNLEKHVLISVSKAVEKFAFPPFELGKPATLWDFYSYLVMAYRRTPDEASAYDNDVGFFYLIDQDPDRVPQNDNDFQTWVAEFVESWGRKLDHPSSRHIVIDIVEHQSKEYHLDDFYVSPSGWRTYNQFFARSVRPGLRPISDFMDDRTVVFPADSRLKGNFSYSDDTTIGEDGQQFLTIKKLKLKVSDLLPGSAFASEFQSGFCVHVYLSAKNYHRYHLPVRGTLLEKGKVLQRDAYEVKYDEKKGKGQLVDTDGFGYQISQTRGWLIVESPEPQIGKVAIIPVGMGQVSGVVLLSPPELKVEPPPTSRADPSAVTHIYENPEEQLELLKGQEFGYFQFGGSDIVMLFQESAKFAIDESLGMDEFRHQGRTLGHFHFQAEEKEVVM